MDKKDLYLNQAKLILQVIPCIADHHCFALKGGTAINFFVRNLPRLSVDIDLAYLPIEDRKTSLLRIENEFKSIKDQLEQKFFKIFISKSTRQANLTKFVATLKGITVKIEVSPVLRGSVFDPVELDVCSQVEEKLGFASIKVLSFEDLFAGKICAALDRQHPRDLFDINLLLQKEGITQKLFKAFLVYLISSNRPIVELLFPNFLELKTSYMTDFQGMSFVEVSPEILSEARENLLKNIYAMLSDKYKKFLISFKQGNPEWKLLGLNGIDKMPAVRWKMYNLNQMEAKSRKITVNKLEEALNRIP